MPIKFVPLFTITPQIARNLMRIEAAKQQIIHLPVTARVLSSLRESARLYSTHYSTQIEGNRLDPEQVEEVVKHEGHFPGKDRDQAEVKRCFLAYERND